MSGSPWNPKFRNTRHTTFKAKVREELICAICLDFLSEPKVLSCAHSFCLECLEQTSKSQLVLGSGIKPGELECPSCRQVSRLPRSGKVKDLITNHTLKRLVSVVSSDDKKATRELISSRSSSMSLSRTQTCSQHRRKMDHYCVTCNKLLCSRCVSSHKGHECQQVDKILPAQVQALRSLIQPACEVIQSIHTCILWDMGRVLALLDRPLLLLTECPFIDNKLCSYHLRIFSKENCYVSMIKPKVCS